MGHMYRARTQTGHFEPDWKELEFWAMLNTVVPSLHETPKEAGEQLSGTTLGKRCCAPQTGQTRTLLCQEVANAACS
eukprot:810992-Amphidinium_carterae.1